MILTKKSPLGFGRYINMVARTESELAKLVRNPNSVLNEHFEEDLMGAQAPKIVVHQSTKDVMHVVIPWDGNIDEALGKPYAYPSEYDPNSGTHIDPKKDKEKAIMFRVGDYTCNHCR